MRVASPIVFAVQAVNAAIALADLLWWLARRLLHAWLAGALAGLISVALLLALLGIANSEAPAVAPPVRVIAVQPAQVSPRAPIPPPLPIVIPHNVNVSDIRRQHN